MIPYALGCDTVGFCIPVPNLCWVSLTSTNFDLHYTLYQTLWISLIIHEFKNEFNFLSWAVVSCSLDGLSAVTSFSDALHPPLLGKKLQAKKQRCQHWFPSIISQTPLYQTRFFAPTQVAVLLSLPTPRMLQWRGLRQRLLQARYPSGFLDSALDWIFFKIKYDQRFWDATVNLSLKCWAYHVCVLSILSEVTEKRSLQFGKSLLGDETLLSQERQYSKWRLHLFGFSLIWNQPWRQVEQWPPKIGLSTNIPSHIVEIRLPRAHPVLAVPDCNWHEEQDWCFIDAAWEPTLWRILVEVEGLMVLQVQAVMGQGSRTGNSDKMTAGAESFVRPPLLWSKVRKPSTVGAGESSMLTIAGFVTTGF